MNDDIIMPIPIAIGTTILPRMAVLYIVDDKGLIGFYFHPNRAAVTDKEVEARAIFGPKRRYPIVEYVAREPVQSLLDALPRCHCGKLALWMRPAAPEADSGAVRDPPEPQCDEHKGPPCVRGCCEPEAVPGQAELRRLLEVMG